MSEADLLANISIVLVRPRFSLNIGACCRAMHNMGLGRLIVVAPEKLEPADVRRMATHAALSVADNMQICDTVDEALAPYTYVAGTTARMGKQRQMVYSPRQTAEKIVSLGPDNSVAILFGPEDRGLHNDDLKHCQSLINIPTSDFSSLNLSQAVMVLCYELFQAATTLARAPSETNDGPAFSPRLAEHYELEGMYAHLKDALLKIDFINRQNPDYWMNNFRRFFSRIGLTAKEVRLIRGICRQINWYGDKRYADGRADNKN